jgi:phospholipase C
MRKIPRSWRALAQVVPLLLALGGLVALVTTHTGKATAASTKHAAISGFSTPIQHVVFMIQENHSFDNLLGYWCVQTGRCDGTTVGTLYGGKSHPLTDASDVVVNVGHSGANQITAIDGGKMNGFSEIYGCTSKYHYQCYSQYRPSQIPNIISLASSFALSDHTFGDGPTSSWGMHLSAVTADLDGFTGNGSPDPGAKGELGPGWGCNSGDDTTWISPTGTQKTVPSCVPDYSLNPSDYPYGGAYQATPVAHVPTIMDELDAAGLSWKIYAGLGGTQNSNGYGWSICPTFADCIYTDQSNNLVNANQVLTDARSGNLPNFSVVTPTQANSQHNDDSMAIGDNWIGEVVSAIEHGPDWSSTAIFLTWDDCGCFYDHVAPPAGYSIRVPMIIISPYAIAGHTDSNDASYASVLAFAEHDFHLPALSSLDASAYDYSDSFNFSQKPLKPVRMVSTPISAAEQRTLLLHPPNPNDPT